MKWLVVEIPFPKFYLCILLIDAEEDDNKTSVIWECLAINLSHVEF